MKPTLPYPAVDSFLAWEDALGGGPATQRPPHRRTIPEGILLRPALTEPIEIYSDERIAEFDEAEAKLAA